MVIIHIYTSISSDELGVTAPNETTGKDTEFSLVGSFRNK